MNDTIIKKSNQALTAKYYLDEKKWFILPGRNNFKGSIPIQWKEFKKLKRKDFDYWRINSAINFESNEWKNGFSYYAPYFLLGEANEIMMIDIDEKKHYEKLAGEIDTLKIETYRGGHLFFKWDKELADLLGDETLKVNNTEIKMSGITPLPPFRHPLGIIYKWNDIDKEIAILPAFWKKDALMAIRMKEKIKNAEKADIQGEDLIKGLDVEFQHYCYKNNIELPIKQGERYDIFCKKSVGWMCWWLGNKGVRQNAIMKEALRMADKYVDMSIESEKVRKDVKQAVGKFYGNDESKRQNEETEQTAIQSIYSNYDRLKEPMAEAVRWTKHPVINNLIGHSYLGQAILIYGRPGSGKTSLIKKILTDNERHDSCFILIENTQESIDETAFNQWMFRNSYYNKPDYLKDYVYSLDFLEEPIHKEEKHKHFVDSFQKEERNKRRNDIFFDRLDVNGLLDIMANKSRLGIKLFGLDSLTLLDQSSNRYESLTDRIKKDNIKIKNFLIKERISLLAVAHATPTDTEGDKIYNSSHYLNFFDKVVEIRKPKSPNESLLSNSYGDYIHKELYIHKNRPYDKDWGLQYLYNRATGDIEFVEKSENKPKKGKEKTTQFFT